MNTFICRSVRALSIAAVLAANAAPSWADTPPRTVGEPTSLTVRFADLNPATAEGARVLYGRIKSAANKVCGPSFSLWQSDAYWRWRVCYQATIDHTVSQLNLAELTALHRSMTPAPANQPALQAGNR
jgi:UrcA family protein